MALITSAGRYGLLAMYELANHDRATPMDATSIAKSADIPKNYLNQLMIKLKKADLIQSIRGKNGGFVLIKDPKDISVKDILLALEGDMLINDKSTKESFLELFFLDINERIKIFLDISLEDLKKYQDLYTKSFNYSI
jgi:Rrf2 family protein